MSGVSIGWAVGFGNVTCLRGTDLIGQKSWHLSMVSIGWGKRKSRWYRYSYSVQMVPPKSYSVLRSHVERLIIISPRATTLGLG